MIIINFYLFKIGQKSQLTYFRLSIIELLDFY